MSSLWSVLWCIRASIVLGPSEGVSLMNTHSSKEAFFKVSSIGIYFVNILIPCGLSLLSCFQVSVTVTTFAVFTSWMYLLGGDDNCMLSVPSSTCDLHISCWQGGDICQAIAAATFTLFNYALWFSAKCG